MSAGFDTLPGPCWTSDTSLSGIPTSLSAGRADCCFHQVANESEGTCAAGLPTDTPIESQRARPRACARASPVTRVPGGISMRDGSIASRTHFPASGSGPANARPSPFPFLSSANGTSDQSPHTTPWFHDFARNCSITASGGSSGSSQTCTKISALSGILNVSSPSVVTTCTGADATTSRHRLPAWAGAAAVASTHVAVPPGPVWATACSGQPSASQSVSIVSSAAASAGSTYPAAAIASSIAFS